jgi:phenylalanyl-tRNA synthetase alpha subunit
MISKISIGEDEPIIYIPLEKSDIYINKFGNGHHGLTHPWAYYRPITLPIFGTYDGCDGLEDIIKNDNTKIIEKHFNMSIEDFVDQAKQPDIVQAGCFIHPKIYKLFTQQGSVHDNGIILDNKNSYYKEYDKLYNDLKTIEEKYSKLFEALKKKENRDSNMYRDVVFELRKLYINRNTFYFIITKHDFISYHENVSMIFKEMYTPQIEKGLLKEEIVNFKLLEDSMFGTNSHYTPMAHGYQYGNHHAIKRLYEKSLDIVINKIKEYGYE